MPLPRISVIIPVFNHATALAKSLRTLAEQTYRPLEVVIVNDGSTDNFSAHEDEFRQILVGAEIAVRIITQKNQGAPAARNRGLVESTGSLVICWDADTLARATMLAELYKALKDHPEASFSYCQFRFGLKLIKSAPFNTELLRRQNYIDTTSLVRREHMVCFDESLKRFQDWDVWLTLAKQGRVGVYVPKPLFEKIVHGRKGYSAWFPSFFLKFPWKTAKVRRYLEARQVIFKKHGLSYYS
jgi:glycosyltransferase involved in cell wall biosynthesis